MNDEKSTWLNRTPIPALPWLNMEVLIFAIIIALAFVSRFYDLGVRVMSHDESLHTYFSWLLYKGQGYEYNPMMHGPLQFHLLALSYFLFGASDFTARIPAALFSIATIFTLWHWRRYLGRAGMIAAAVMMLISPYMLFYGRYVRNEAYAGLYGILMLYAILRYLETGLPRYLYLLAAATVLHFTIKETAFIYTAEAMIFLAAYFIAQVTRRSWEERENDLRAFVVSLIVSVLAFGGGLGLALANKSGTLSAGETASPAIPGQGASPLSAPAGGVSPVMILLAIGLLAIIASIYFLIRGYGLQKIRQERSFDMLLLLTTLILPMLTAFPVKFLGGNPTDYSMSQIPMTLSVLLPLVAVSIFVGLWWNRNVWWKAALLFYVIFTVFYTTMFTNGSGFFAGLVGALGYWLEQQGVQRGSQPWYYYILIQIPMYEFLPAIASIFGFIIGRRRLKEAKTKLDTVSANLPNTYSLLGWWVIASIVAFTFAGEKMPWLTYHLTLPMILFGGWAIGSLLDRVDWQEFRQHKAILSLGLLVVLVLSLAGALISALGSPPPFTGKDLDHLRVTISLIISLIGVAGSLVGLYYIFARWSLRQAVYLFVLSFFGILAILTTRTAIRAAYINYDNAQEYLVYAHGFTGIKDAMQQITELSEKTTGGLDIVVGYDDAVSWPLSWYLRDFTNARYYGSQPTNDLRNAPAILVGSSNYSKIEPIVGNAYYEYDYIRMVWPNQDYFNLTWDRLQYAITNPDMRAAILDVWLNRDFTKYATATGSTTTTISNWQPSDRMRLYIRKDAAQLIWNYGTAQSSTPPQADPYEKGTIQLKADESIGAAGNQPGQLNAPRGIAIAPDGTIYVADSRNNRIEHFTPEGKYLNGWGTFADISKGSAPIGTFNEPWGVAVGPDGSVYVTDTWNHRVEKFDASGKPLTSWGTFGTADTPGALYGPRGITVDSKGRVYVADTGNKRIVVFDSNGKELTSFGSEGSQPGQFDEPVDVKLDSQGNLFVTDTWNQRVQEFSPSADGLTYTPLREWPISGWYGQSLDNKPYIVISPDNHVFVTDPEGYRVIEFDENGTFVQAWGQAGTDMSSLGQPSGITIDQAGHVWVTDAANNRIMRFSPPAK